MRDLIAKARKLFPGTKIQVAAICAVDECSCRSCYEECNLRVMAVFAVHKNKQIGWFENGYNLVKTNPKPSKRYKKRILGDSGKKPRRPRKHWLAKFQQDNVSKVRPRTKTHRSNDT